MRKIRQDGLNLGGRLSWQGTQMLISQIVKKKKRERERSMYMCADALASEGRQNPLWEFREGFPEVMTHEQNPQIEMVRKGFPGQGNSVCKGLVMQKDMHPLRNLENSFTLLLDPNDVDQGCPREGSPRRPGLHARSI